MYGFVMGTCLEINVKVYLSICCFTLHVAVLLA